MKHKQHIEGEGFWDDVKQYAVPATLGALATLGTAAHLHNEYKVAKSNKEIGNIIDAANERSKKHFGRGRKREDLQRMLGGVKKYSIQSLGGAQGTGFWDDIKDAAVNHIIPAAKAVVPLAIGVHKAYNALKEGKAPEHL